MKFRISCLFLLLGYLGSVAQIGYQLTLLNSATGEARANETVNVELTLTNNEQAVIYKETQRATTDDFGILSLTVGTSSTFSDVDWNKLPFFITAKVDGTLIGKQQILSVPIAEYAKKSGDQIDPNDIINKTFIRYILNLDNPEGGLTEPNDSKRTLTFLENGIVLMEIENFTYDTFGQYQLQYIIKGNLILILGFYDLIYVPEWNCLKEISLGGTYFLR